MALEIRILRQDNYLQMSLLYAARQISFEEKAEKIMAAHFNREGRLVRRAVRKTWPKGLRGTRPGSSPGSLRNIRPAFPHPCKQSLEIFLDDIHTPALFNPPLHYTHYRIQAGLVYNIRQWRNPCADIFLGFRRKPWPGRT
ncbi:MAG TPA: hypothetical protein ENI27_10910 [bacterium]|nr:hypothetical protein [bacterium]